MLEQNFVGIAIFVPLDAIAKPLVRGSGVDGGGGIGWLAVF